MVESPIVSKSDLENYFIDNVKYFVPQTKYED